MANSGDQSPSRLPAPSLSSQAPRKDASKRTSMLMQPGMLAAAMRKPAESRPAEDAGPRITRPSTSTGLTRTSSTRTADGSRVGAKNPSTAAPSRGNLKPRPVSYVPQTRTTRPESSISIKSPTEAAPSRSKPPVSARNNMPGLKRSNTSSTTHSRSQSASTVAPRPGIRRNPTTSDASESKINRPAFSTLQQHYSPKKNLAPKPASATLIHAQPVDLDPLASLDTQLLQARLLQLTLLHSRAEPVFQAWQRSARQRLKHEFITVSAECASVQQREREQRQRHNMSALVDWCGGDLGLLAEHIGTLGTVVTEVVQLVDEGGRVQQAIEIFETWMQWVEAVYQTRDQNDGRGSQDFIEGLGDGWEAEVSALGRKLSGLARQLDDLGETDEGSNLFDMLSLFKSLVKSTEEELRTIQAVEREVVKKERRWIDEQVSGLDAELAGISAVEVSS